MNNLHRELAPISDAAWAQIEEETSRTFKRYLAARRVADVQGPAGTALSAVGTGHLRTIAAPKDGILARQREVNALVELRASFELDRTDHRFAHYAAFCGFRENRACFSHLPECYRSAHQYWEFLGGVVVGEIEEKFSSSKTGVCGIARDKKDRVAESVPCVPDLTLEVFC